MAASLLVDDWKQKRKKLRQMQKYENINLTQAAPPVAYRRQTRHRLGVSTLPAFCNRRNSRSVQVLTQTSNASSSSSNDQLKSIAQVTWHSLGHDDDDSSNSVAGYPDSSYRGNNALKSARNSLTASAGKNQFVELSSEILKNMGHQDGYRSLLSASKFSHDDCDIEQGDGGPPICAEDANRRTSAPIPRKCPTPILRIAENGQSTQDLLLDSLDYGKNEDHHGSKVLFYQPNSSDSRSTGNSKVSFGNSGVAPCQFKPLFTESFDKDSKIRFFERQKLLACRTKVGDICVIFAFIGIVIMMIERELTSSGTISIVSAVSVILKTMILVSTLFLIFFVVLFHIIEIQLFMLDYGAHDWRVAITRQKVLQILRECLICIICPFPGSHYFDWTIQADQSKIPFRVNVPLDVWLGLPMFLRFYLFGRSMVLHSRQFQDVATRTIASLNQVNVNVKFVLKSQMSERPMTVLVVFTSVFWVIVSWGFMHCEQKASSTTHIFNHPVSYSEAIWFIIVTFMSIGYGDITPRTHCGRFLASLTGIVGILIASALITVVTNMMALTKPERHVNTFMADSHIQHKLKSAAANVLQQTWFIHKHMKLKPDKVSLRLRQRNFLQAITRFKATKWELRRLTEESDRLLGVDQIQKRLLAKLCDLQENQLALSGYIQEACKKISRTDKGLKKLNEKFDYFDALLAKRNR